MRVRMADGLQMAAWAAWNWDTALTYNSSSNYTKEERMKGEDGVKYV